MKRGGFSPGMPGVPRPNKLIHFAVFQLNWFVCVLSAANGYPWVGVVFALGLITLHLFRARFPRDELKLVLTAILIGAVWESFLVAIGLLIYPNGTLFPGTAPYWILSLWAVFATELNISFRWLRGHPWWSIILGAIAGPAGFWSGSKLGAVLFTNVPIALTALAIGWAILTPLVVRLAQHWDGVSVRD